MPAERQAVQVEVDRETGQVKILQYVAASDCGTVIYPIGAEGQVELGGHRLHRRVDTSAIVPVIAGIAYELLRLGDEVVRHDRGHSRLRRRRLDRHIRRL